jgi:hypothetical protein
MERYLYPVFIATVFALRLAFPEAARAAAEVPVTMGSCFDTSYGGVCRDTEYETIYAHGTSNGEVTIWAPVQCSSCAEWNWGVVARFPQSKGAYGVSAFKQGTRVSRVLIKFASGEQLSYRLLEANGALNWAEIQAEKEKPPARPTFNVGQSRGAYEAPAEKGEPVVQTENETPHVSVNQEPSAPAALNVSIPTGTTHADQFVIKRYGNGVSGGAQQILGWGAASMLAGTARTRGIALPALIASEGFGDGVSLLNPVLSGLTIAGYNDAKGYYASGGSVGSSAAQDFGKPTLYDGAVLRANGALLDNVHFFYIPGTALRLVQAGTIGESEQANLLRDVSVARTYGGLSVKGKNVLENIEVEETRDFAIRVEPESTVLMQNIHTYSANAIGLEVLEGSRVYVENIYPEQSLVGMRIHGDGSYISGLHSHTNRRAVAEIFGNANQIDVFDVWVASAATGFQIGTGSGTSGSGTVLMDGQIGLSHGSVGVRLAAGNVTISNVSLGGYGATNRVAIRAEKVINDSYIDIDCNYLDICLDLNYLGISRLGRNNTIIIKTTDGVTNAINLPVAWDPSNQIYIDGFPLGERGVADLAKISANIPVIPAPRFTLPNPDASDLVPETAVASGTLAVPTGLMYRTSQVIPRFGDGQNFPAGQILGSGETLSALSATAYTRSALVSTEDWGKPISQAEVGTYQHPEFAAAVLAPLIRDVAIRGYPGHVGANPERQDAGRPDLYDGVRLQSSGGEIDRVSILGIPGTALVVNRNVDPRNGQTRPFDQDKPSLRAVSIANSFRGLYVGGVDHFLSDVTVGQVRDYAVHLRSAAAQVHGLRTWGSGSAGIWVSDGASWLNGEVMTEGQRIGMKLDSNRTCVRNLSSSNHSDANIEMNGGSMVIKDFDLDVIDGAAGFRITGQRNLINNGAIQLNGRSAGIHLTHWGRQFIRIRNTVIEGSSESGEIGLLTDDILIGADIELSLSSNLETGIDLNPSSAAHPYGRSLIGWNNIIKITVPEGDIARLIRLPATWHASNHIYINGEKVVQGAMLAAGSASEVGTVKRLKRNKKKKRKRAKKRHARRPSGSDELRGARALQMNLTSADGVHSHGVFVAGTVKNAYAPEDIAHLAVKPV